MNKTVTVNIAGIIFHIDEDAYNKLNNYLEAIRTSINTEGREEIIHDIETRIAELFTERIDTQNQTITQKEVDQIIQIMGQPEDYILDDEDSSYSSYSTKNAPPQSPRKIYRDGNNRILGGVLSGLGHYLRIDAVWIRLLFALLILVYGTGVVVYLILWIIIPKAKSTSEILEMQGEPINISSIEKKVRENIDFVSAKVSNIDYAKVSENTRGLGNTAAFIIKRFIGLSLIVLSVIVFLISSIASLIFLRNDYSTLTNDSVLALLPVEYPVWNLVLAFFLLFAIPCIIFFLLGLKIIYSNIRYVGLVCIGLFIVWIISLFASVYMFMDFKKLDAFKRSNPNYIDYDNEVVIGKDTLQLKVVSPEYFESNRQSLEPFLQDAVHAKSQLAIEILNSYQNQPYLRIKEQAGEKEVSISLNVNALSNVVQVETKENTAAYPYEIKDNMLILSNGYLKEYNKNLTENKTKIYLYLPEVTVIQLDHSIQAFLEEDYQLTAGSHTYRMIANQLSCTDCN